MMKHPSIPDIPHVVRDGSTVYKDRLYKLCRYATEEEWSDFFNRVNQRRLDEKMKRDMGFYRVFDNKKYERLRRDNE